jgi:hypothetical protein
MRVHDFMENNGKAIMHDMINTGGEDGDYTQAETEQDTYDIGIEPLFPNNSISTQEGIMNAVPHPLPMPRGSAKGRRATHWQRIGFYAKIGWKYQSIPFVAPSNGI